MTPQERWLTTTQELSGENRFFGHVSDRFFGAELFFYFFDHSFVASVYKFKLKKNTGLPLRAIKWGWWHFFFWNSQRKMPTPPFQYSQGGTHERFHGHHHHFQYPIGNVHEVCVVIDYIIVYQVGINNSDTVVQICRSIQKKKRRTDRTNGAISKANDFFKFPCSLE